MVCFLSHSLSPCHTYCHPLCHPVTLTVTLSYFIPPFLTLVQVLVHLLSPLLSSSHAYCHPVTLTVTLPLLVTLTLTLSVTLSHLSHFLSPYHTLCHTCCHLVSPTVTRSIPPAPAFSGTASMTFILSAAPPAEAFSDMAGMAFQFYQTGEVQPLCGTSLIRPLAPGENATNALSGIALRDMADPQLDGSSVNYVENFTATLDPHYASGVPNKVSGCLSARLVLINQSTKSVHQPLRKTIKSTPLTLTPHPSASNMPPPLQA